MNGTLELSGRRSTIITKRLVLPALIALLLAPVNAAQNSTELLSGLSEYQRFKAYPRVDMAYRLVAEDRIADAIVEIEKAREAIPLYRPLASYHANLLLLEQRYLSAAEVAAEFPNDAELTALAAEAHKQYALRPSTGSEDMIKLVRRLPVAERDALIRFFVFNHQQLTNRELKALYELVPATLVTSDTAILFNQRFIQQGDRTAVSRYQQRICSARTCHYGEWRALFMAYIEQQQFDQVQQTLNRLPEHRARLIDDVIERMVARGHYPHLLSLMTPYIDNNSLTPSQVTRLYTVARTLGDQVVSKQLLAQSDLSCAERAQQQHELGQAAALRETLANCPVTAENAKQQLLLLTENRLYETLAQKRFVEEQLIKAQRSALVDHYNSSKDWSRLVALLSPFQLDQLTANERRVLATALKQQQRVNDASDVVVANWQLSNVPSDLELATYYLTEQGEYQRALALISTALAEQPDLFDRSTSLRERSQFIIDTQVLSLTPEQRSLFASLDPTSDILINALLRNNACSEAINLYATVSEASKDAITFNCDATIDKRLARLLQSLEGRPASQRAEAAFLLIAQQDYAQADAIIVGIEDWQQQWLLVDARLSIAVQQNDKEKQRQLFAIADQFYDRVAETAIRKAYFYYSEGDFVAAARQFNIAFNNDSSTQTTANLEQAAYANLYIHKDTEAKQLLTNSLEQRFNHAQTLENEDVAKAQQLYKEVDSPWGVTLAGWIGDSSAVSVVTANDFQADYFLNAEVSYNLNYDNRVGSDISLAVATLSGGENTFFDNEELDFHLAWRPWTDQQAVARFGIRHNFDTDDSRTYIRASYDPLQSMTEAKSWSQDHLWPSQSLFLDAIYYIDSGTYGGYARYKPSYDFAGRQRLFYQGSFYPFVQYQLTNDTLAKSTLSDTRAGLGISSRSRWGKNRYRGYNVFLEASLEWQHVISSDISKENDNALLLRFALYY